jgi:hypothetical protein
MPIPLRHREMTVEDLYVMPDGEDVIPGFNVRIGQIFDV